MAIWRSKRAVHAQGSRRAGCRGPRRRSCLIFSPWTPRFVCRGGLVPGAPGPFLAIQAPPRAYPAGFFQMQAIKATFEPGLGGFRRIRDSRGESPTEASRLPPKTTRTCSRKYSSNSRRRQPRARQRLRGVRQLGAMEANGRYDWASCAGQGELDADLSGLKLPLETDSPGGRAARALLEAYGRAPIALAIQGPTAPARELGLELSRKAAPVLSAKLRFKREAEGMLAALHAEGTAPASYWPPPRPSGPVRGRSAGGRGYGHGGGPFFGPGRLHPVHDCHRRRRNAKRKASPSRRPSREAPPMLHGSPRRSPIDGRPIPCRADSSKDGSWRTKSTWTRRPWSFLASNEPVSATGRITGAFSTSPVHLALDLHDIAFIYGAAGEEPGVPPPAASTP